MVKNSRGLRRVTAKIAEARRTNKISSKYLSRWIAWLHRSWKAVGLLVIFLALLPLKPSVSIEPSQTLDARDPFGQRFTITNKNFYGITEVHALCGLEDVEGSISVRGINLDKLINRLEPEEEDTLSCNIVGPGAYEKLQIAPRLVYRLPFGLHACQAFPLLGEQGPDGSYIWNHISGDEACGNRGWLRKFLNLDNPNDPIWGPESVLHWDDKKHYLYSTPVK